MTVARYVVGDRGVTCGAGRFEAGASVFETWLDGQGDRLARLGIITRIGEVEDDDPILDADCTVGDPHWLGQSMLVGGAETGDVVSDLDEDDDDDAVDLGEFDPSKANAADVLVFVEDHPEQLEAVLAAEVAGKNRVGLVRELTARQPVETEDEGDEDE